MTIYDGLDDMRSWIARGDWNGLEAAFHAKCEQVTPSAAARIADVALDRYEADLGAALARLATAVPADLKAVYWEFDPDNGWQSSFFLCQRYEPEAVGDDDWAASFRDADVLPGPGAPELAAEFGPAWDRDDKTIARNLYLIARTIASVGRVSPAWRSALPFCAGFHDQHLVYRIRGE